ncbi:MAG TPA: nuclear transport factor 2 family protein [Bryobacteraceae bacterium]|nr:nuclear transport factor 2 family protein [Bryobacteraceae bacterium]
MKSSTRVIVCAAVFAAVAAIAQPAGLTDGDRTEIQALMGQYARALSGCHAMEFADLFVPETGYFDSGFRGHMVGHKRLVELVESEPHCVAPKGDAAAGRPGGANGPNVVIEETADGVRGIADLGTAEYQDEYVKTAQGWRFASRAVIIAAEKAAGLDARGLLAIQRLGGAKLGDYYEPDKNGVPRLMTSGVRISAMGGKVTGRAFLKDGGYDDQVYEKLGSGDWQIQSSTHVPAHTH